MTSIEAAFRLDYKKRCKQKNADEVSVAFRKIFKKRGNHPRLDEDIWETWRNYSDPQKKYLISELRGAFKFRHWLAHGRHWQIGNTLDFNEIYLLADLVLNAFVLVR